MIWMGKQSVLGNLLMVSLCVILRIDHCREGNENDNFPSYLLRNMRDALNGLGKDNVYSVRNNIKTRKIIGFMKQSFQEGGKE